MKNKQRPVNLDLQTIAFPVTAIASILHRITGVMMFIALAILLWMLATSLSSADGFASIRALFELLLVKCMVWAMLTGLAYHIVAGMRHLIMDMGYWEGLTEGKQSAIASFVLTGVLAVFAGVLVW